MTYYRVFYKNQWANTLEYAKGLTLDEASDLVEQLAIDGFETWYEVE